MDAASVIFELIDRRAFSSLWYWLVLVGLWVYAVHWVIGVPFDMVRRAQREEGQAKSDLYDIARINVTRIVALRAVGPIGVGLLALAGTVLVLLGFWYRVELAQGLFFLIVPLIGLSYLSWHTAQAIVAGDDHDHKLYARLSRHRNIVQFVGLIWIFLTSLWGMGHVITSSPFAG